MNTLALDLLRLLYIGSTETFLVYAAFQRLLRRREDRNRLQYAAALLIYAACTIFDAANNFPVYFVFIFCYVLITVISLLFYDNPLEIRLIIPFLFVALNYSATIIATTLVWSFTSGNIAEYPPNLAQNFVSQTLLSALFLLFVWLFSRLRSLKSQNSAFFMAVLTICCPLLTLILLVKLFYQGSAGISETHLMTNRLCIAGLLFLTALTLFYLADRVASMHESLLYSATLEQMLAMQEKYYASLQEHQQDLRRISHDIKNHSRVIAGLIEQGRYDEAKDYSLSVANDTRHLTPVTECVNQLIGALLNDKLSGLREKGVGLTLCVMVPAVLSVKNVDMCILLGNLLDNAVEACARMDAAEHRFIDVDIRLKGPILCVCVRNSYGGRLQYESGRYLTSKSDLASHGLGLSNVQRVAEKYNGRLTLSHSDGVFTATALLYYPNE